MFVDLHIHSYFSDGAQTPEQAAETCRNNGVGLAALCDHNSWLGTERFGEACRELGVIAIRGAEFDCHWSDRHLHLLAYRFTPTPELAMIAHRSRELLLRMSFDLIKRLKVDYPSLSTEEYQDFRYDERKGGWAGLHYLCDKGIIPTPEAGMPLYRKYGLDYASYSFPSAKETCLAILNAGGVPVLAHPCTSFSGMPFRALFEAYDDLRALGVAGIETHYPGQDAALTLQTSIYCERYHMITTSGSDSHGQFPHTDGWEKYQIGQLMTEPKQLNLGKLVDSQWLL